VAGCGRAYPPSETEVIEEEEAEGDGRRAGGPGGAAGRIVSKFKEEPEKFAVYGFQTCFDKDA